MAGDGNLEPIDVARDRAALPHRGTTTDGERRAAELLAGHVRVVTRTGALSEIRYDNALTRAALACAAAVPRFADVREGTWRTGDFDTAWFARAGIPSLTLSATDDAGLIPWLHRPGDVIAHVDQQVSKTACDPGPHSASRRRHAARRRRHSGRRRCAPDRRRSPALHSARGSVRLRLAVLLADLQRQRRRQRHLPDHQLSAARRRERTPSRPTRPCG